MLKYKVEYETISVNEYEKKHEPSAASQIFQKESRKARHPTRPSLILKSWDEKRRPRVKTPSLRLTACEFLMIFSVAIDV